MKTEETITPEYIRSLSYTDFVGLINQWNVLPGAYSTLSKWAVYSKMNNASRLLEVACTTGFSSRELATLTGCSGEGFDLSEKSIEMAKYNKAQYAPDVNLSYVVADGYEYTPQQKFTHIAMGASLGFFPDPEKMLGRCIEMLEDGGYVLASPFYITKPFPEHLVKHAQKIFGITPTSVSYKEIMQMYNKFEIIYEDRNELIPETDEELYYYCKSTIDRACTIRGVNDKKVYNTMYERLFEVKKMSKSNDHTITLELTFPEPFAQGIADSYSTILRPLNKFLKDGSKIGKLAYLFYSENGFPSHVLGSILYSERRRLIFFPGLKARKYLFNTDMAKTKLVGTNIDHLTLETHKRSWHLTSLLSRKKDTFRTFKIAPGVYYWFGMSIRNKNCLEITPAKTILSFNAPGTDSERRMKEMVNSRHKSRWPNILMNRQKPDDHFIHFDFIVDMRFLSQLRSKKPLIKSQPPSTRPVLIKDIPAVSEIPVMHSAVQLPTFPGRLIINTCYSPGSLSNESYFTSVESKNTI